MTHRLLQLPPIGVLALLAACTTPDAPTAQAAAGPEEQFRAVCQQRLPNAVEFGLKNCMFQELERTRSPVTPVAATPAPAPATRATPPRRGTTQRRAR